MAVSEGVARGEDLLHEELLWHGTSKTNPEAICMGQDGVDDRLVRWCSLKLSAPRTSAVTQTNCV
mgnify:FL=1